MHVSDSTFAPVHCVFAFDDGLLLLPVKIREMDVHLLELVRDN